MWAWKIHGDDIVKTKKRFLLTLTAGVFVPGSALALGLGSVHVVSEPGMPFKAVIPVRAISTSEADSLSAQFPDLQAFHLADVPEPPQGWKVVLKNHPHPHILITAPTPVSQTTPLLVQLQWTGGQVVREYVLHRDVGVPQKMPAVRSAPAVMQTAALRAAALQAAAMQAAASHTLISPKAKHPIPVPASSTRPPHRFHGWSRVNDYGRVPVNTCLSDIVVALQVNDTVTPDQIMAAIVKANPAAFQDGNPNRLYAGRTLKLPDLAQVQALSPVEAAQWLTQQSAVHPAPTHKVKAVKKATHSVKKPSPAHRLVLSSAPPALLRMAAKQQEQTEKVVQDLSRNDKVLQKKVHSMGLEAKGLATQLSENAARIQRLVQLQAQPSLNGILSDASLGGNVLLLAMFVWMYRRQSRNQQRIEELQTI